MQKYCLKKGKSSLVRDRDLPFKFEESGTFLYKETSKLPPYHLLHHAIHHFSLWPATQLYCAVQMQLATCCSQVKPSSQSLGPVLTRLDALYYWAA